MTADRDDALAWAGDEPESRVEPSANRVELVDAPAAKPSTPSVLLISYGILGGIYLIYTIGWVISVQRLIGATVQSTELLNSIMFQLGQFLAMGSPAIWFAAVFVLTRGRKPIVRLLGLLSGLITVLPWPFVIGAWL